MCFPPGTPMAGLAMPERTRGPPACLGGLALTEIARDVRLREDVLERMEFEPGVLRDVKLMEARV